MKESAYSDQVYNYLMKTGNRISKVKSDLRKATYETYPDWAMMCTSVEQAELMKMMIQLSGAKRGIEVGTFTGYSALVMAEALPSDGLLVAIDMSEEWTNFGKKFWKKGGVDNKIQVCIGDGCDILD